MASLFSKHPRSITPSPDGEVIIDPCSQLSGRSGPKIRSQL